MAVGSTQPTGAQKHDDGKPAMKRHQMSIK
jgi:hypothetical protein